jgi:hypothetical protein
MCICENLRLHNRANGSAGALGENDTVPVRDPTHVDSRINYDGRFPLFH